MFALENPEKFSKENVVWLPLVSLTDLKQEQSGGLWLCSQISSPSSSYLAEPGEIIPGGLQGSTAQEVTILAGGGGGGG